MFPDGPVLRIISLRPTGLASSRNGGGTPYEDIGEGNRRMLIEGLDYESGARHAVKRCSEWLQRMDRNEWPV
jgi:hypothetical protein